MLKTGIRGSFLCIAAFLAGTLAFERQVDASFLLSDLIASNGTVLQGDKLFSNFSYSTGGAGMPAAAAITISGTTLAGNHGINIAGSFTSPGPTATATLNYIVTVVSSPLAITSAIMSGNPVAPAGPFPPYLGTVNATQTFSQNGNSNIISATTGSPTVASQSTSFSQQFSLNVQTAIAAFKLLGSPNPSITSIDQTFGQSVAVPEPGSALIMITGAGIFGLNWIRRRRSVVNA